MAVEGSCAAMADCAILAQARHCEWGLVLLADMRAGYGPESSLYRQSSHTLLLAALNARKMGLCHWPRSSRSTSSLIACVACRVRLKPS